MNIRPWTQFYPDGAEAPLNVEGKRLTTLLDHAVRVMGDRPALTLNGMSWSFTSLGARVNAIAHQLRDAGVEPGDRVAMLMPNMPVYVAAMFATWSVGGTVVQINAAYVDKEIRRILDHAGPKVLVTTADQLKKFAQDGVPVGLAVFEADETGEVLAKTSAAFPAGTSDKFPDAGPDIAVLQYTGGTTGLPKAVMLTHENLLANVEQRLRVTLKALHIPTDAKLVNTLPMCHVYGLTCVTLSGVAMGLNQLIVPRFHARTVLEMIRDENPFAFYGVPTMYAAFLREPDLETFCLDRVAIYNSAGAPMPHAHWQQFQARVGRQVLSGFGISEASPTTHTYPDFIPRREGSSGIPVPLTDVRVVQPGLIDLVDVPPGEVGELAVRGPQVMKGYWGQPELTEQTLRDGWLLTGDLVTVDSEGYLYVVGRQKDVIVASGYNVYPAEVERAIGAMQGVAEVAVIGSPHPYRGETVKAVLVLRHGASLDVATVIDHCRRELAPFKVPTFVEIVTELPRTAVGKIDKKALAPSPLL